jgi:NAD(P)-dependent dehydrogenase (short-subunit alcohol dehydrogenase family)
MNNQQRFVLGVLAGAAATFAASRAARRRHAIGFTGRVVVITGGSRGLGLVLARQFADEGAHLCLLARKQDELERAREQLLNRGAGEVMILACDVRSRASVDEAIRAVLDKWTRIDVLINNAGVIQVGPLEHMKPEDFENAMATHFWGPYHLIDACAPSMRRRGFGRIVNVTSIGGRIAVPHLAPYCASKFALVGLSDAVRAEMARYGVRVTTVAPGLMRTGSPINADVKGQHAAEFTWFAISDSLPGISMSAERAARQIIDACRYGDPELTITMPAKIATVANVLAPAAVASAMMLATRILPGPEGEEGDRSKQGRESQTRWAPSVLTALTNRAAVANNENP